MTSKVSPRAALFVTTLSSFLTAFASSSINVALPSIGASMHASPIQLNWTVTAFLLTSAMLLIPTGRAADIVGRKKVFVLGIATYMVTGLGSALCRSVEVLIALRAVQGVGGAMIFSTAMAIVVSVYPSERRGHVIGINTASVYVGLSVGPFLGGILTQSFGWPTVFLINVLAGMLILPLVFTKLKGEWRGAKGQGFDLGGSVVYAASLAALLYGFSRFPSKLGIALAVAGLAGLGLFVAIEGRVRTPILPIGLLLHNRGFALSNLAAMINYSATFAVSFFLSLYLQNVKGMSPRSAGLVLVVQPVVQAALSPACGKLSDKVEPRVLASLGMLATAVGLIVLVGVSADTHTWYVAASLALLGGGFALFSSPNSNAVLSSVGPDKLGVANAMLGTMRTVGMTFSMALALLLQALLAARPFVVVQRTSFLVCAVLCVAGIFASLARGNVREPR